jgi:hypothetical protein
MALPSERKKIIFTWQTEKGSTVEHASVLPVQHYQDTC